MLTLRGQFLHEKEISIDDTGLGRKRILFEQQFVAASITMSDEQWHHCVQMRKQRKVEEELELEHRGGGDGEVEGNNEAATGGSSLNEEGAV